MNSLIQSAIKNAREKSGLTQRQVEESLGLRKLTIRDYEMGRLKLPFSTAIELAKLYQVSLNELCSQSETRLDDSCTKSLGQIRSLFSSNGFGLMLHDPVVRAYYEEHKDKAFDHSLFDLLALNLSDKEKDKAVITMSKALLCLARSDGKVSEEEIRCIRFLLQDFNLSKSYKELSKMQNSLFLPGNIGVFERVEVRHFLIWVMFFFAQSDGEICYQEIEYIEQCAVSLKVNRSNFLFIKSKFVTEEVAS